MFESKLTFAILLPVMKIYHRSNKHLLYYILKTKMSVGTVKFKNHQSR